MALLFDLDGTLVDSAQGIAAALTILRVSRGGLPVSELEVSPLVSRGVSTLVACTLGARARDDMSDVAEFRRILRDIPADPATIYPGVPDALQKLCGVGLVCGVVTNKPERLSRQLLVDLDLAQYFSVIVGGDTLPVCKPDPAPLQHAVHLLGGKVSEALMIGDSNVDAAAAAAAGMPFLLFEGGYGPAQCDDTSVAGRFVAFADLPSLVASEHAKCLN